MTEIAGSSAIPPAPEEPPKETDVEFHKPKPVHSWREFFKEYAIIVLGVLTALLAEQTVEWLHWQGEVKVARKALAAEISTNSGYFARRLAIGPCLQKQIDEARAILTSLETGKPPPPFTVYRYGMGSLLVDGEWQSERASQVLTHFPREELAAMSRHYTQLGDIRPWISAETDVWGQLEALRNPPAGLGPSDFARLRGILGMEERYAYLLELNSRRMLKISDQLKINPEPVDQVRIEKYCTGSEEEYARYMLDNVR